MTKLSKRKKQLNELVDKQRVYSLNEALELLKSLPPVKFIESVEVAVALGIDPRKSDQVVRGSTELPHGTGKTVRIAVFAQGEQATKAVEAGADRVGLEDLAEEIKGGELNFDIVIATPDTMPVVGKLGQILGPKGLMPSPKVGTVAQDVEAAIASFKAGKVRYRVDRGGTIHTSIGKVNFAVEQLAENLNALITDLKRQKPSAAKGIYLKKLVLSTTMGPGLSIDMASF